MAFSDDNYPRVQPRYVVHRYTVPRDVPVANDRPVVGTGPALFLDYRRGTARVLGAVTPAGLRAEANAPTTKGGWTADRYTAPVRAGDRAPTTPGHHEAARPHGGAK